MAGWGARLAIKAVLALLPLTALAQQDAGPSHRVQPGDTLHALALRYGTTVEELKLLNDLSSDLLRVGQRLLLPGPAGWRSFDAPEDADWASLAIRFRVQESTLRTANPALATPASASVRIPPDDGVMAAPDAGEDLLAFAARLGVAPGALVARNGLEPPFALRPGEPLLLPDGALAFGAAADEAATVTAAPVVPAAPLTATRRAELHERARAQVLQGLGDLLRDVRLAPPDDGFAWPLAGTPRITSRFGWRAISVAGNRFHQGLDLAAPPGTPVLAARDGTVTRTGWIGAYGYAVYLQHGDGFETRYAHLQRIGVEPGERLQRGDPLGAVGSTGASTGPHLHFEIRRDGVALDPLAVLPDGSGGRIAAR